MPKTWCCPFWRGEKKTEEGRYYVFCEGARLRFPDIGERKRYINERCAHVPGWEECTMAQHLLQRYERENDDA